MSLFVNSVNPQKTVVTSEVHQDSRMSLPAQAADSKISEPALNSLEDLLFSLWNQGISCELGNQDPMPLDSFTKKPLDHVYLGESDQGLWTLSTLNPRRGKVETNSFSDLSDLALAIRSHHDRIKAHHLLLESDLGDLLIESKKAFKGNSTKVYFCRLKRHYRFVFPKGQKSVRDCQCLTPNKVYIEKVSAQLDTFTAARQKYGAKVSLQGRGNPIEKVTNGALFHVETTLFGGKGDLASFQIYYKDPISGLLNVLNPPTFDMAELNKVVDYIEKVSVLHSEFAQDSDVTFRPLEWNFWSEEGFTECQSLEDTQVLIRPSDHLGHFELMARCPVRDIPLILPTTSLEGVSQTLELLKWIQQNDSESLRVDYEGIDREDLASSGPFLQVFREVGEVQWVYLDPESGTIQKVALKSQDLESFQAQKAALKERICAKKEALLKELKSIELPSETELILDPEQSRFELRIFCPLSKKERRFTSRGLGAAELRELCARIERFRTWSELVQHLPLDDFVPLASNSPPPAPFKSEEKRIFLKAKPDYSGFSLYFYDPQSHYRVRRDMSGVDQTAIERGLLAVQKSREFLEKWQLNTEGLKKTGPKKEEDIQLDQPRAELSSLLDLFDALSLPQDLLRNDGIPISLSDARHGLKTYIQSLEKEQGIPGLPTEAYAAIRERAQKIVALLKDSTEETRAKGLVQLAISALGHCGTRVDRATSDLYRELTGTLFSGSLEDQIYLWTDLVKDSHLRELIMQGQSKEPGHEYHFLLNALREHPSQGVYLSESYGTHFGDEYEAEGKHRFKTQEEAYQAFRSVYNPLSLFQGLSAQLDEALEAQDCQISSQILMFLQGYVERNELEKGIRNEILELEATFQKDKKLLAGREDEIEELGQKFSSRKARILLQVAEQKGLFSWNEEGSKIRLSKKAKLALLEDLGILLQN